MECNRTSLPLKSSSLTPLTNEDEEDCKRGDVPVRLEQVLSGEHMVELIHQLLLQVSRLHRSALSAHGNTHRKQHWAHSSSLDWHRTLIINFINFLHLLLLALFFITLGSQMQHNFILLCTCHVNSMNDNKVHLESWCIVIWTWKRQQLCGKKNQMNPIWNHIDRYCELIRTFRAEDTNEATIDIKCYSTVHQFCLSVAI